MEELIQQMKVYLADNVAFGMKAQQYHWNVEGDDFAAHHDFLGNLYTEVDGVIDQIGEFIRTLDAYAPLSPARMAELTTINDTDPAPEAMVMMRNLYNDNNMIISQLQKTYTLAERFNEIGLSNFLQDRTMAHKQHLYMLRATLKGTDK